MVTGSVDVSKPLHYIELMQASLDPHAWTYTQALAVQVPTCAVEPTAGVPVVHESTVASVLSVAATAAVQEVAQTPAVHWLTPPFAVVQMLLSLQAA